MKKILSLLITFCSLAAFGQYPVSNISFTLPPNPPANTAEWATAMQPVMILAQTKMQNGQIPGVVKESKILVTIKSGGSIICGSYNPQTAPQSNFNSVTKSWSGAAVPSLLGKDCILKPGTYELCVQFYGLNATQGGLLGEACKSFTVADTKEQGFTWPRNIVPDDGKIFTEPEISMPILFKWKPVLPKPKEDLLYIVRVVKINKGQSKAQALQNNTPLAEIEVKNLTQTSIRLSNRVGEPTAGDSIGWDVEAFITQDGRKKSCGKSAATAFKIK